jgi:hypothetical protein
MLAIATGVTAVTVIGALADLPSKAPVMIALPGAIPVTTPAVLTAAIDTFDELQEIVSLPVPNA